MTSIEPDQAVLVLVDVQVRLVRAMHDPTGLIDNLQRLIRGAGILDIPVVWTEQYPEGLGPTVPEVAGLLSAFSPVSKVHFSCCGEKRFIEALVATGRRQVLLAGIESHVCIFQSARDLVRLGYAVQVVADAVSSRTEANRHLGLERAREAGASITSVESALFEMLQIGRGETFKRISAILK